MSTMMLKNPRAGSVSSLSGMITWSVLLSVVGTSIALTCIGMLFLIVLNVFRGIIAIPG
jgi:hypothetical protein